MIFDNASMQLFIATISLPNFLNKRNKTNQTQKATFLTFSYSSKGLK